MEEKNVSPSVYASSKEAMKKLQGPLNKNKHDTCMNTYSHLLKNVTRCNFLHVISQVATALITLLLEQIL